MPPPSPAQKYVARNRAKYQQIEKDLLMLKPFEGQAEAGGGGQRITFRMAPPSVIVLLLNSGGE